jgi:hypothetical protein
MSLFCVTKRGSIVVKVTNELDSERLAAQLAITMRGCDHVYLLLIAHRHIEKHHDDGPYSIVFVFVW